MKIVAKQLLLSNSREMNGLESKYLYLALLLFAVLSSTSGVSVRERRKPSSSSSIHHEVENSAAKTAAVIPDQIALATSRSDTNEYLRNSYPKNSGREFTYSNLELNLVRPESDPIHTKITTQYSSTLSTNSRSQPISLEDSETAEEYVANAMKMYGARLQEPIRAAEHTTQQPQTVKPVVNSQYTFINIKPKQNGELSQIPHQQELQIMEHQDLQQFYKEEYQQSPYGPQQQPQHPQYQTQEQELPQQTSQESSFKQHSGEASPSSIDTGSLLESQLKPEVSSPIQKKSKSGDQSYETQSDRAKMSSNYKQHSQEFEIDSATRSYKVIEDSGFQPVDRSYRTKYLYYTPKESEEKVRVSASTEIPKAEIMKQIEKSVLKYMKELESEGKIIAKPQEPKTYYKVISAPTDEDSKYVTSSSTTRPKYTTGSGTSLYRNNKLYEAGSMLHTGTIADSSGHVTNLLGSSQTNYPNNIQNANRLYSKQHYQTETESNYKPPHVPQTQEVSDSMAPNVEFIYKIKTRAPLQTATVKTISKPYSLPLKTNYDQFDHSAALKSLEEFDLTHAVSPQEDDEHRFTENIPSSNKPSKLYFNSEIYHDINSLPYKQHKQRLLQGEHKKPSSLGSAHDYNSYSGYFAEPGPSNSEKEELSVHASSGNDDGNYDLINSYKYSKKQEPKLDEESMAWEEIVNKNRPSHTAISTLKALESDSYSPKYNNNPEGYGYQHTYKTQSGRHAPGKRGKRGNSHISASKKLIRKPLKDLEAAIALRPPPKKNL